VPILNILVPQVGQVPEVAGFPFFMVMTLAFFISFLARHFTQYPCMHVNERESSRDQMRSAVFDDCYRRCSRKLAARVYSQGCATCEGTGYLHHVYAGDGEAETLDALFAIEFHLLDVATEQPKAHQHYRLCGIPCTCKLGHELLTAWRKHPEGYPVDDAEVARLRVCGMPRSDAVGWLAFLQGDRERSPVLRRSRTAQPVGTVPIRRDNWWADESENAKED
jgi:hypothetical protein